MTAADELEAVYRAMREPVHANATSEEGLVPVGFMLTEGTLMPTTVVGEASRRLDTVLGALNRQCEVHRPRALLVAIGADVRDVDGLQQFREIVEEGGLLRPSEADDSVDVVVWLRFVPGDVSVSIEPAGEPGVEIATESVHRWINAAAPSVPYFEPA